MQATREDLESIARQALVSLRNALKEIKERELHKPEYSDWETYLLAGTIDGKPRTLSWWNQIVTSANAAERILADYGITLGNEAACRDVRMIAYRQVTKDILPRVLDKAQFHAGEGQEVKGKHIKAVIEEFVTIIDTGGKKGMVWVEDEMIAFDAAIKLNIDEAKKRQTQYAHDGAKKNGWSKPCVFGRNTSWKDILPWKEIYANCPEDAQIELQWRIVEPADES